MDAAGGCSALLGLLLLGFATHEVHTCGIITHINIGQRATKYFEVESGGVNYRKLIQNHPDAFQAGNPFPDTFYNALCRGGQFHAVSEDTHWTPFANATVNYIRRKYPQPWSTETEKLVAFLFGIIEHSVADTTWHSLGIEQGFLHAMANINFHGSYGNAHPIGDFGGDVVNMVELDTRQINILDNWYIPTADLVEIYKEYYGYDRMDADTITECSVWMYLGRAGERLGVINLLYPILSDLSPFLTDRMQDYFVGAMDDMVAWTSNGWRNIITMIDNGTSSCKLTENPLFVDCGDKSERMTSQGVTYRRVLRSPHGTNNAGYVKKMVGDMDASYVTLETTERGVYIKASDKLKEKVRVSQEAVEAKKAVDVTHESAPSTGQQATVVNPNAYYDTNNRYARVGTSMMSADMNNDGHADLVVGAPGHGALGNYMQGRVYIVYGAVNGIPNRNLTLDDEADVILDGTQLNAMFGHAVAVVDLNSDGINDLAVSAPSVGGPQLTYHGEVYVYLGQATGGISSKPDLTMSCRQKYCNLGWSMTSGDVNQDGYADLIVGAPFAPGRGEQSGFVGALYSKKSIKHYDSSLLSESDFDWMTSGPQKYSWYGYDVSASSSHLVIGAPAYRICVWADCKYNDGDIQAAGKVFIFNYPLTNSAWRTFVGDENFDYLGSRVLFGNFGGNENILAFGVPAKKVGWLVGVKYQAGVSRVYDVSDTEGITKKVEYRGNRGFARFGLASAFEDMTGDGVRDILIGSPHWTDGFWFDTGALRGRVFVFDGTKASGNIKNADIELSYGEDKAKFGTTIISVRNTNTTTVAVGAPGSNAGANLGGRIAIFSMHK